MAKVIITAYVERTAFRFKEDAELWAAMDEDERNDAVYDAATEFDKVQITHKTRLEN